MKTINIHKWKGIELENDFIDFVNTGAANARAIASYDTGSMVKSISITKTSDGYKVDADAVKVARLSKKRFYYPERYSFHGYRTKPAFDFLMEAFEALGDDMSIGNSSSWTGVGGQGRGRGFSTIRDIKIPKRLRKG